MVYLDYNATTPLAPQALEAMMPFLKEEFGNPSSIHAGGRRARAAIDDARDRIAACLSAKAGDIVFTGGGTESCNLAILGLARAHTMRGRHIITSAVEHHAVLHACEYLKHYEGYEVTVLPVDRYGRVNPDDLNAAITPQTTVVSIMHANNETGTFQPIKELGAVCKVRGVFFHTDAVQTFGKVPISCAELGITALSIAGHKFYGPRGAGALYVRPGVALAKAVHGGSQENSRRPGTENTAAIVGQAAAAEFAIGIMETEQQRLAGLRDRLWEGIRFESPRAVRNGHPEDTLANTLSVSFPGTDGESLLIGLDIEGVGASSGSACMVGAVQPSHVLIAMGVNAPTAAATVRFSLGHGTTVADIEHCITSLSRVLSRQRQSLSVA